MGERNPSMDITALDQGAWFDFPMTKGRLLKLKLRPASGAEKIDLSEKFSGTQMGRIAVAFAPFVVGWNLTKGEDPVPCNDETKIQYLNFYLLEEFVQDVPPLGEDGPPRKDIWLKIYEIIGSLDFFSLG
jgi:hypothetical protein